MIQTWSILWGRTDRKIVPSTLIELTKFDPLPPHHHRTDTKLSLISQLRMLHAFLHLITLLNILSQLHFKLSSAGLKTSLTFVSMPRLHIIKLPMLIQILFLERVPWIFLPWRHFKTRWRILGEKGEARFLNQLRLIDIFFCFY